MTERLRAEYEKYLNHYGLKPRKLPSRQDRTEGQREVVRIMYEEAKSRGDPMADSILIAYEKNRDRYLAEARHPATIQIEEAAAEVEATIRALPAFAKKLQADVFVGEFPTGSINCQTVKVDGGFLVLVNSGTLMMLQQVVTFLWRGDADDPLSPPSLEAADGVAHVLAKYVEYGDPFYGPKPIGGGLFAMASSLMSAAAMKFVVAHEYGHILAGHFAEPNREPIAIETEVGVIDVLQKNHEQEFEADEIGYRLTLGVAAYEDFNLKVIDVEDDANLNILRAAMRQKSLIAAPFVPLTIDAILDKFRKAARSAGNKQGALETHPAATDRIERLLGRCPSNNPHYSGFINLPFMLLPSVERIVTVITDLVFRQPQKADTDDDHGRNKAQGEWLEDIMRCVDAIRSRDFSAATLILTDAFEKQRTILEPDVDVVLRELVRAALGRKTDIRRTLLERHRDRRATEQYLEFVKKNSLSQFTADPLLGPHQPSLADLSDLGSTEEPNGLGLVKFVLEEAARGDGLSCEVHLLDAVLSAWRGERERAVSSLETALDAGIADPDGLLARFVALEKHALKLEVRLDIQALLEAVAQKALSDKCAACKLAGLLKDYTEYLGVPLGPVAQRMINAQMQHCE